jgi:hypothetical protein
LRGFHLAGLISATFRGPRKEFERSWRTILVGLIELFY